VSAASPQSPPDGCRRGSIELFSVDESPTKFLFQRRSPLRGLGGARVTLTKNTNDSLWRRSHTTFLLHTETRKCTARHGGRAILRVPELSRLVAPDSGARRSRPSCFRRCRQKKNPPPSAAVPCLAATSRQWDCSQGPLHPNLRRGYCWCFRPR